jgi:diguanylate cyclase (GGDEF)-like protein
MAQRGIAGLLADRLSWRQPDATFDVEADRGWIAKILATLFGFGGILLLSTLLLEGAPGRDSMSLAIVAGSAIVVALFILNTYERLPVWSLRAAPAIGTLLVCLSIYYAGPQASAAYAMYMACVVIAASLFLDTRLIVAHAVLAIGAYAFVLSLLEGTDGLDALRITMMAGTVLVLAMVMGGIVGQLRQVLHQLEAAASTDPLTGLLNRRALEEAFDIELARAARGRFDVGVVMLDLDGFKDFNDQHGHQAGDAALERLSHVLTHATRAIDHVGRVGGEEFAILAPESGTAGTLALAERLRRAVEIEFSGMGGLTASCGVASYPEDGSDRYALVGAADRALYKAKALGRNRAVASSDGPPSSGTAPSKLHEGV